ncbi:dihydrodipicolinate synthetase [Rhodocollybia butyracea]|uniref:Dihydrodipicolinate synthetase n=1 Tax=Rhodocollybia butyracea TaxID=206335 RepID=A0A9P5TXK1_9AGAR|nr:dihydrodipicolinate synthetase [Rhodocollybia butyracea]
MQGGVTGILIQGSNGEAQHLSHSERFRNIVFARQTLDDAGFKDVVLLAGTGAQSARETKELCVQAKEAGAGWVLVLTPSTWAAAMGVENILKFHREVADNSPIPCMIYNFPTVTAGIDLDSDILSALATHPNIVGTKLSCGNVGKIQRLSSAFDSKSEFATFAGKSDVFLHTLLSGGAGTIGALVNVAPKIHTKVYKLFLEYQETKDASVLKEAFDLQAKISAADWAVSKIGGVGGVKAIVAKEFGYGGGTVRNPLKEANLGVIVQSDLGGKWWSAVEEVINIEKSL